MILSAPHHRVRIATHNDFESFVLDSGKSALAGAKGKGPGGEELDLEDRLEFFGIGGDPKELMAYMVKSEWSCEIIATAALTCSRRPRPATRHRVFDERRHRIKAEDDGGGEPDNLLQSKPSLTSVFSRCCTTSTNPPSALISSPAHRSQ